MNDLLRRMLCLPEEGSTVAAGIDWLHFSIILVTMFGAGVVGLAALWFAFRYRRRPGDAPTPRMVASGRMEWTIITALVALFVGWWWIGYKQYLRLQIPPTGAMEVLVSAKQWMWKFAYPGGRHTIALLVVPAGQPVKLVMTSRDVIHGFFVPAFRIKHDVVPGCVSVTWFEADHPGIHPIFCTQYCGVAHSLMRGKVVVLSPQDFAAWTHGDDGPVRPAAEQQAREDQAMAPDGLAINNRAEADPDPVTRGRQAAASHGCLACHTEDGQRHIGPTWRGLFGSTVALDDGSTVVADADYLTRKMMDPRSSTVVGYQAVMPSYQGRLDPDDAAAIVEFIRAIGPDNAPPPADNPPLPRQPYQVGKP